MNIVFFDQHAPRRISGASAPTIARFEQDGVQRLLGGIAHELGNCVSPLSFFCEMLAHDGAAADAQELEGAQQALARCTTLLEDLRALSGPAEAGSLTVDAMIAQAGRVLRIGLPRRIAIETHVSPDLTTIDTEIDDVRHAILALGLTAADAMPQGGRLGLHAEARANAADPCSGTVLAVGVRFAADAGRALRAPERCGGWRMVRSLESEAHFEWCVPLCVGQAVLPLFGAV